MLSFCLGIALFMTNSTQVIPSFVQEAGEEGGGVDFPGCHSNGAQLQKKLLPVWRILGAVPGLRQLCHGSKGQILMQNCFLKVTLKKQYRVRRNKSGLFHPII